MYSFLLDPTTLRSIPIHTLQISISILWQDHQIVWVCIYSQRVTLCTFGTTWNLSLVTGLEAKEVVQLGSEDH